MIRVTLDGAMINEGNAGMIPLVDDHRDHDVEVDLI